MAALLHAGAVAQVDPSRGVASGGPGTFSDLTLLDGSDEPAGTLPVGSPSGTTSPAGVAAIGDRPGFAVRAGHLPFVGGELRAAGSQPGEDAHAVPATDDRFASLRRE